MPASIYTDKEIEPNDELLSRSIGESKDHFDAIYTFVERSYGSIKTEWKYYNKKSGWILKMFHKKRNILFIIPCVGYFRVAFTFGEKAMKTVFESDLPESIKMELQASKKYAEGRTIKLKVKNNNDCNHILQLIQIKLSY